MHYKAVKCNQLMYFRVLARSRWKLRDRAEAEPKITRPRPRPMHVVRDRGKAEPEGYRGIAETKPGKKMPRGYLKELHRGLHHWEFF